jgi:TPP-dependent pyruvate/acetoin dehydrogenase alpha subunit
VIHVNELTQPQGHSSGPHERYKDADRLAWEREFDCIRQMKLWMIAINIASSEELDEIDANAKKEVLEGKKAAWSALLILLLKNKRTSFLIGKNS